MDWKQQVAVADNTGCVAVSAGDRPDDAVLSIADVFLAK